ncbi:hypothetical protein [Phenylobacterium sp.]|uniref:hypothetical protein n=1 Tax=Phenylobacterium sp. TaxID=1871053 RepID=UPI002736DAB0|nr:hypothetical protein [Phenylobacterium sp.]MDZ4052401.1 hypothetical protein [Phenylobacterium sp.]
MRYGFVAAIAGAMLVGLPAAATAAPLIIATKVAAKCKILPDGTAATVMVTLNNATYNFYGQSLVYHFTPNTTGVAQHLPMPAGGSNPVTLTVSPGVYTLQITNQMAPGGNASANYNVTVPAGMVSSLGGRKMCLDRAVKAPSRIAKEKMLAPE